MLLIKPFVQNLGSHKKHKDPFASLLENRGEAIQIGRNFPT